MPQAHELATDALFTQYLNVVNNSLGRNSNKMPYEQMLDLSEKLFDEKTVAVGVYKERMDQPHDWFVVGFENGRFNLEEHGKGDADLEWRVREAHLEEVVDEPEPYIEDPYKLDLDWLKKAAGLEN